MKINQIIDTATFTVVDAWHSDRYAKDVVDWENTLAGYPRFFAHVGDDDTDDDSVSFYGSAA